MKTKSARNTFIETLKKGANFLCKDNTRLNTMQLIRKEKLSNTGYFLGRKSTRSKDNKN